VVPAATSSPPLAQSTESHPIHDIPTMFCLQLRHLFSNQPIFWIILFTLSFRCSSMGARYSSLLLWWWSNAPSNSVIGVQNSESQEMPTGFPLQLHHPLPNQQNCYIICSPSLSNAAPYVFDLPSAVVVVAASS
jgi:hypothetical protein